MHPSLTPRQLIVLRRCSGGLRVWEIGNAFTTLLAELNILCKLQLVIFQEGRGFETTASGEAWLVEFDE